VFADFAVLRFAVRFLLTPTMGELTFFLGLQVEQRKDGIFLSQDKYVGDILQKFGFSSVKIASTRMEIHKPLSKDAGGTYVDVHLYRSMIGSLMYLTSSRPDIMFKKDTGVEKTKTKRVAEETLLQESFKKLRAYEASRSEPEQEQQTEESQELSEEELQKLLVIVPVEEIYVEALHVRYPI
ncbi:hypothetical protein Tco_0224738, partial [Tanacetum coccineum]